MDPIPTFFAERRRAAAAQMARQGGGVMLLPAAEEKIRNADTEYLFRQDSDHHYLVGLDEPEGCAVLLASPAGEAKLVLFVRPRDREKEILERPPRGRRGREGALRRRRGVHRRARWTRSCPSSSRARRRSGSGSARTPAGTRGSRGSSAGSAAARASASGRRARSWSPAACCTSCGS